MEETPIIVQDVAPKTETSSTPSPLFDFPDPSGKGWKKQEKDSPPSEPKKPGRPLGSRNKMSKAKLRKSVGSFYLGAGMLTIRFVDEYDGTVILHNGEELTEQTLKLAEEYPWVMKTLESWSSISTVGGFFGVLVAVGIPIMVNHRMLPEVALEFVDAPDLPKKEPEGGSQNGSI